MTLNKHERILLYGSGLWYFGEGMLGPLFAVFAGQVGGNVLDITWAWGVFLFTTGLLTILIGRYAEVVKQTIGYERLMVAGYIVNAVATFGYLLVSDPTELLIVQVGIGIAIALSAPTWLALYDRYSGDTNDAFVWALQSGAQRIVYAVAIVIGGLIVTHFSFSTLFFIMGCIQVCAAIYTAKILKLH